LRFSAEKTQLRIGEDPIVDVSITNNDSGSVTLVEPGDGSENGWRTPIVSWSVIEVSSKAEHPSEPIPSNELRCVYMNLLKADELFTLAPSETKDLYKRTGIQLFKKSGVYKVVLLYANHPLLEWREPFGEGSHDKATMKRVKESTACSLKSNEVIFTVTK